MAYYAIIYDLQKIGFIAVNRVVLRLPIPTKYFFYFETGQFKSMFFSNYKIKKNYKLYFQSLKWLRLDLNQMMLEMNPIEFLDSKAQKIKRKVKTKYR